MKWCIITVYCNLISRAICFRYFQEDKKRENIWSRKGLNLKIDLRFLTVRVVSKIYSRKIVYSNKKQKRTRKNTRSGPNGYDAIFDLTQICTTSYLLLRFIDNEQLSRCVKKRRVVNSTWSMLPVYWRGPCY